MANICNSMHDREKTKQTPGQIKEVNNETEIVTETEMIKMVIIAWTAV